MKSKYQMVHFSKQLFKVFVTSMALLSLTACDLESGPLDPNPGVFDMQKLSLIAAKEIIIDAVDVFPDSTRFVCVLQPFSTPELLETEANETLLDQINQSTVSEDFVRVAIFDAQFRLLSEEEIRRGGRGLTVSGGPQWRDACRDIDVVTVTILQFDDSISLEFSR